MPEHDTQNPAFPPPYMARLDGLKTGTELTEETFGRVFGKSALTRRGLEGIRRNLGAR